MIRRQLTVFLARSSLPSSSKFVEWFQQTPTNHQPLRSRDAPHGVRNHEKRNPSLLNVFPCGKCLGQDWQSIKRHSQTKSNHGFHPTSSWCGSCRKWLPQPRNAKCLFSLPGSMIFALSRLHTPQHCKETRFTACRRWTSWVSSTGPSPNPQTTKLESNQDA